MPDLAIIGEAYGEQEALQRRPFVGAAGRELQRMLSMAGLSFSTALVTNVFNERPPSNDVSYFFTDRKSGLPLYGPLRPGRFLNPAHEHHLLRLETELKQAAPKLILALGNSALWFLRRQMPKISKERGTVFQSLYGKAIATFHPAAVLRDWSLRPIVIADLMKAKAESTSREIQRLSREIWIKPTLLDIVDFRARFIDPSPLLAFDTETTHGQISCISLAPDKTKVLVIPFFDPKSFINYWPSVIEETRAVMLVKQILEKPLPRKITQNGMYDWQYLRTIGIEACLHEDTTPIPHALWAELPQSPFLICSLPSQ